MDCHTSIDKVTFLYDYELSGSFSNILFQKQTLLKVMKNASPCLCWINTKQQFYGTRLNKYYLGKIVG